MRPSFDQDMIVILQRRFQKICSKDFIAPPKLIDEIWIVFMRQTVSLVKIIQGL